MPYELQDSRGDWWLKQGVVSLLCEWYCASKLILYAPLSDQGEDEESEDADYAPDARGGSDAESSSDSDGGNDEDSDDGAQQKSHKRPGTASTKHGANKKQVGYMPSS